MAGTFDDPFTLSDEEPHSAPALAPQRRLRKRQGKAEEQPADSDEEPSEASAAAAAKAKDAVKSEIVAAAADDKGKEEASDNKMAEQSEHESPESDEPNMVPSPELQSSNKRDSLAPDFSDAMVEVHDEGEQQIAPDNDEDEALARAVEASLLDEGRRKRPRDRLPGRRLPRGRHNAGGDVVAVLGIMQSTETEANRADKQPLAEAAWDEHDAMNVEEDEMQQSDEEADDDHSASLNLSDEDEDEGADPHSPSY